MTSWIGNLLSHSLIVLIGRLKMRSVLMLGFAAAALVAAPASAVTTFATYSATAGTNIRLVNSGNAVGRAQDAVVYSTSTASGTAPGAATVNFSFIASALAPFVTNVQALYTLNGTIAANTPAQSFNGTFFQNGFNGTFSFVTVAPITVQGVGLVTTTYAAGSNLLSGTFSNGTISGSGSAGGSAASGAPNTNISFTSDFLDFSSSTLFDRAQSLTATNPTFGLATNGALRSFRAVAGGSWSANPVPKAFAAVPEPASWAMLVMGFGIVGATVRRRRRVTVVA